MNIYSVFKKGICSSPNYFIIWHVIFFKSREVNVAVCFLSLLLVLPTSFWQIHKNDKNVRTFCFPSTLVQMFFSEELWLTNLFSDSFSFAIFSLSCKYSISDFCDTIKVSKLDKDGRWNTYFKKYICKSITAYIIHIYANI